MEDKRSFFEHFCKARLVTENEKKKKFLKPLSVVKEVCEAFALLFNKTVKFTEAFKYVITSRGLAVTTPESTVYQPDKAGLINYCISLSKSSTHEYPRYVMWVVDGWRQSAQYLHDLLNLLHHQPQPEQNL